MYHLEYAKAEDIEICSQIIEDGKQFQRQQGFVQWTDDYPNRGTICRDVREHKGYVVKSNGVIAGYMCVDFSGEPAYDSIEGHWQSDKEYAVIHRMAFHRDFRGTGLADLTFGLIEKACLEKDVRYIRVDTDFPNKRMQHILEKNGFNNAASLSFRAEKNSLTINCWNSFKIRGA
ncbi:MAG: GNAT family N-acetyltransferase [Clostridia bacterium]